MSIGWGGIIEDSHDVQVSGIGAVSVRSSQTRQARRMTAGILSDSLRLYPVKAVSFLHPPVTEEETHWRGSIIPVISWYY